MSDTPIKRRKGRLEIYPACTCITEMKNRFAKQGVVVPGLTIVKTHEGDTAFAFESIKPNKLTPGTAKHGFVYLNFCPICGKRLLRLVTGVDHAKK